MAVKTITIDLRAYGLLLRRKRDGQSFSDVIKEHFGVTPSAGAFKTRMRDRLGTRDRLDSDFFDAMEAVVLERKDDPLRTPELPELPRS
jgi:hypothetical protein